jgi:Domain of unknown function (DUF4410)
VEKTWRMLLVVALALMPVALIGQEKPTIVLHPFTAADDVAWPYDMKQMQTQTIAEVRAKIGKQYAVTAEAPPTNHAPVYTLDGEILSWHAGNRAERMLVGWGTGREWAEIHYWLTDNTGKRVLDRKDMIKAEFWGNAYEGSVGQLSHPVADKIAKRLADAKLD